MIELKKSYSLFLSKTKDLNMGQNKAKVNYTNSLKRDYRCNNMSVGECRVQKTQMVGVYKLEIVESADELKQILGCQKTAYNFERIQWY